MSSTSAAWSTPNNLSIKIPLEEIDFEMSDLLLSGADPVHFLAIRVDNAYNFSRVLRTIFLFVAFFQISSPWATLIFTVGGFLLGYCDMFVRDYFPASFLIDFLGMIYSYLFKFFFLIPLAVIITAIVTNSYLLIALYFISLIATVLLRFIIDIAYVKFSLSRHGIALSVADAKAVRVIYQYGKAKRTMSFRTYFHHVKTGIDSISTPTATYP